MSSPKVTVITASTGNPILRRTVESVVAQTHSNVQHLIFADGPERWSDVDKQIPVGRMGFIDQRKRSINVVKLPYSIGKDRWNGHRMYAAGSFIAEGEYIMFLDDDNTIAETHIEDCLKVIEAGNQWAFSFRNITDKAGNVLCEDNCESLGKWASVLHPEDLFIDVNCFFLPRLLAVQITPLWFRKFREPGQPEIDRVLSHAMRQIAPKYDTTYKYTVNYTVGNTENSVQKEFFDRGNAEMLKRYGGNLPWK